MLADVLVDILCWLADLFGRLVLHLESAVHQIVDRRIDFLVNLLDFSHHRHLLPSVVLNRRTWLLNFRLRRLAVRVFILVHQIRVLEVLSICALLSLAVVFVYWLELFRHHLSAGWHHLGKDVVWNAVSVVRGLAGHVVLKRNQALELLG